MSDELFGGGPPKPAAKRWPDVLPSGMKRPSQRMLDKFQPRMVENMAVSLLIDRGFSLGICCRNCGRLIEWTPQILAEKFKGREGMRLPAIYERLECGGEDGCGASDVAIFPYFPGQDQ